MATHTASYSSRRLRYDSFFPGPLSLISVARSSACLAASSALRAASSALRAASSARRRSSSLWATVSPLDRKVVKARKVEHETRSLYHKQDDGHLKQHDELVDLLLVLRVVALHMSGQLSLLPLSYVDS